MEPGHLSISWQRLLGEDPNDWRIVCEAADGIHVTFATGDETAVIARVAEWLPSVVNPFNRVDSCVRI